MSSLWSQPSLSRDFARLSAVIIFALLLASIWVAYATYADHSEKVLVQLKSEAARIDRAFSMEIENDSYVLQSLGKQIVQRGANDPNAIVQLIKSFDANAASPNIFAWITPEQLLTISSNKGILERPVDSSDRDYVKKAMAEPWKVQIGRPIEGRVSQRWVIPLAMGLTDGTGKFVGTVALGVDINALTNKITQFVDEENVGFAISTLTFAKVGQHAQDDNFFENYFPKERLAALDLTQNKEAVFSRGSLVDGRRIYSYYKVSEKYPYLILAGYGGQLGKGPMHSLLWPRLLQLLVMACFLMALLWIIRLRIIRPVIDLSDATSRIARGESFIAPRNTGAMEVEMLVNQIKKVDDYITEKKRIEDELLTKALAMRKQKEAAEFSNRIKVEFLASMRDSIAVPLKQILQLSEHLREGSRPQLTHEQADDIYQAALRLTEVTTDIFALSDTTSGMLEVKEKPMKLGPVLAKCLRLLQEQAGQRNIQIKTLLPNDLPRLLMDELRMKQLLINLILASIASTPEGGTIAIEARLQSDNKNDSELSLSFIDSGYTANAAVISNQNDYLGMPLLKALLTLNHAKIELATRGKSRVIALSFPKERLVFLN